MAYFLVILLKFVPHCVETLRTVRPCGGIGLMFFLGLRTLCFDRVIIIFKDFFRHDLVFG